MGKVTMSILKNSPPGTDDRRPTTSKRSEMTAMVVAGLAVVVIAGLIVAVISWISDRSYSASGSEEVSRVDTEATRKPNAVSATDRAKTPEQGANPPGQAEAAASPSSASSGQGMGFPAAAATVRSINVSFRIDPRLTKGVHMGDRWVSPQTYMRAASEEGLVVEARARSLDAQGRAVDVGPVWTPADPTMVAVSPPQGNAVEIRVHRPGETTLTITSGGASKMLSVAATKEKNGLLQVAIKQ
jgi:hypothetical protein